MPHLGKIQAAHVLIEIKPISQYEKLECLFESVRAGPRRRSGVSVFLYRTCPVSHECNLNEDAQHWSIQPFVSCDQARVTEPVLTVLMEYVQHDHA